VSAWLPSIANMATTDQPSPRPAPEAIGSRPCGGTNSRSADTGHCHGTRPFRSRILRDAIRLLPCRGALAFALALCVAGFSAGCALFVSPLSFLSDDDEAQDALALFELAGRRSPEGYLYIWLPTASGEYVKLRRMPLLSSRHITRVTVVMQDDGRPVLRGELDSHGRMIWMQVCSEYAGRQVAVVVDGVIRFPLLIPGPSGDEHHISIPGDWTPGEAKAIAERASENYSILNNRN